MIAGRYSLDREIGRGGMGAVWLGRDEVLGRTVALKRIGLAPGGASPDTERAEREAKLAARLNHPHVVSVFDLVEDERRQWLVMEYVEGTNLSELVKANTTLTPDEIAPILVQAADGLAAAHAAGIVHRDVKPSNILVSPDGQVKLTDFGIARAEAEASLTQTGLVTGSPAYLAPEIASGALATEASDVWSLGATLFHAVAGHPPYDVGENLLGALYRIVHEAPPTTDRAGWLQPLLRGAMDQDAEERWTMAQVRDFLAAGPSAGSTRPVGTRRTRRATSRADDGTQVLSRSSPTARGEASFTPPPPPGEVDGSRLVAEADDGGDGGRRGTPWFAALAVLVVLALVGAVAYVVRVSGTDDTAVPSTPAASTEPTAPSSPKSSSANPTRSTTIAPPPKPTAMAMRSFIRAYLRTAAADPSAGFAQLTSSFQSASGGRTGYRDGFWGNVSSIDSISDVQADPTTLVVSYTYRYTLKNQTSSSDDVQLQLVYDPGSDGYLIAGEA